MSVTIAEQNLKDAKKILDDVGITFWLDAGTLLAVVREGKLFDHDWRDQDIGIYGEDKDKLLENIASFEKAGFTIGHIFEHPCKKGSEIVIHRGGSKIDIFTKPKRGEYRWWLSFLGYPPTGFIAHKEEASHFDNLNQLVFAGEIWNIPSDTFAYLKGTYGEWQIPNHNWDWKTDPLCIDKNWEIF